MYRVFIRDWWKRGPAGLEPAPRARKTHYAWATTEDEARSIAQEYNRTHKPGPLSRKAEFEEVTS
jgi:hypothetical protein